MHYYSYRIESSHHVRNIQLQQILTKAKLDVSNFDSY